MWVVGQFEMRVGERKIALTIDSITPAEATGALASRCD
jgi:hypothetical protein